MNYKKAFIALSIASSQTFANIIPKNSLWISKSVKSLRSSSQFSEDDFYEHKKVFEVLYPTIEFTYQWDDGGVSAFAFGKQGNQKVYIAGGLARYSLSGELILAQIVCHEIGHHLAGAPYSKIFPSRSTERQADYFATTKCMRRYFDFTGKNESSDLADPNNLICDSQYQSLSSQLTCKKTIEVSRKLKILLESISGPSQSDDHPTPQCREKIYIAGAFCKNDPNNISDYCEEGLGARPDCI